MQDAQGVMPYEGALENDWQKLVPGKKSYIHLFYSPADVSTLELIAPPNVSLSKIKLDKVESENLFLNGDFSVDNFWHFDEMPL